MSGPVIRRLIAGDDLEPAIVLLTRFFREEAFDTPDATIRANTQRLATLDICGLFVCAADGEAIGVATVSLDFGVEFGWSGEMGDLYVVPEWRGRGLARLLVTAAETFLKGHGASGYQVTVTPYANNAHGLERFYRRLGFAGAGRMVLSKWL